MKKMLRKSSCLLLAIVLLILPVSNVARVPAEASSSTIYQYKVYIETSDTGTTNSSSVSLIIKSDTTGATKEIVLAQYGENDTSGFPKGSITLTGVLDSYPGYFPYGVKTCTDVKFGGTVDYTVYLYVYNSSNGTWVNICTSSLYELDGPYFGNSEVYSFTDYAPDSFCPDENYGIVGEVVPSWYDFNEDSYSFENYSALIPYGFFKTMYGPAKGWQLWLNQGYQGGLCFGFSYTTAAFNNNLPTCSSVRDLSDSTIISIGNNSMKLPTYIKYAHMYQMSMEFKGNSHWSTAEEIYNIVKQCAEDDNLLCTIGMSHVSDGGHRVLAVGVDGNDILIDDPNNSAGLERIHINSDGSWSFSGLNGWNSDTCRIRYSMDIGGPFKFLKTLRTLTTNEAFIDNTTIDSFSSSFEADTLSKDYLLLSVDSVDYSIKNEDISKIENEYTNTEDVEENSDLYWVISDKTVNISDISENSEISLTGNDTMLTVSAAEGDAVELTVDENSNSISAILESNAGEYYSVTINDYDNDKTQSIIISGIANGENICVEEIDDECIVSGINDIDIIFEIEDHKLEKSLDVTDGTEVNVGIEYDSDNGYSIVTDFEKEDDEIKEDETKEDETKEDETKECSHMCHSSNGFLHFIWKIVNFFSMLFGINPICECGRTHY